MALALYGTEKHHGYLRVRTALQIINNASAYSPDSPTFVVHDLPVLTPDYRQLVRDTLTNGSYSEIVHLFAFSKALGIPFQSYCCPHETSSVHPYTLFINQSSYERRFKAGYVTVMWTASSHISSEPNHFVLLVPYQHSTGLTHSYSQSQLYIPPFTADSADVQLDDPPQCASRDAADNVSPQSRPTDPAYNVITICLL